MIKEFDFDKNAKEVEMFHKNNHSADKSQGSVYKIGFNKKEYDGKIFSLGNYESCK